MRTMSPSEVNHEALQYEYWSHKYPEPCVALAITHIDDQGSTHYGLAHVSLNGLTMALDTMGGVIGPESLQQHEMISDGAQIGHMGLAILRAGNLVPGAAFFETRDSLPREEPVEGKIDKLSLSKIQNWAIGAVPVLVTYDGVLTSVAWCDAESFARTKTTPETNGYRLFSVNLGHRDVEPTPHVVREFSAHIRGPWGSNAVGTLLAAASA